MNISENSGNKGKYPVLPLVAAFIVLAFCIWKSNIDQMLLIIFLAIGVITATVLCFVKRIKIQCPVIIISSIFASLICCGVYYAFSFISDLYLSKFGFSFSSGTSLIGLLETYDIPSLVISIIAYPFAVFITIIIVDVIAVGCRGIKIREYISKQHGKNIGKSFFKAAAGMVIGVVAAAVIGTLLIWTAYSLPSGKMADSVSASTDIFIEEGPRPSVTTWATGILDNYTDALILLEASDCSKGPALQNALMNNKGTIDGADPVQTLIRHYADGEEFDDESPYPRYWHGYTIVLKPLLLLFNYGQIRTLIFTLQLLITVLICFLFIKNRRPDLILPFLLTYLMLMPPAMGKSLQYSSCFFVMLLSVTALLLLKGNKHIAILFLLTGVATAYFDLLTFPIMTFGIPAAIFLSLDYSDAPEKKLMMTVRNGVFWVAGYGGMWASKWLIADAVTGSSVIGDAVGTILLRTSDSVAEEGVEALSAFTVIGRNLLAFAFTPVTLAVICYLIVLSLKLSKKMPLRSASVKLLPYLLIFLLPFLWYAFAANHSMLHFWFTNKALSVSVFSVMCAVSELNAAPGPAALPQ